MKEPEATSAGKGDSIRADVRRIEQELGITAGFMEALYSEDDWSFVIKTHAVLEATLSHLLTVVIGEPRLQPFFARLDMSGATIGKVAIVKLLDLLDETDRRFIKSFSELRNDLVHEIRFVNFTFASHVKSMDANQLKTFKKQFDTWSVEPYAEVIGQRVLVLDFFKENPKLAIWYSAMATIAIIYGIKEIQISARRMKEDHKKLDGLIEFANKLAEAAKAKGMPVVETLDKPAEES
jgi:hypothetical protein